MPGAPSLLPLSAVNNVPADRPFILITFGLKRKARTAIASVASDFSSSAKRRVSPTFITASDGAIINSAELVLGLTEVNAVSMGFGRLVSTACALVLRFVFTAATCDASELLTKDFGAGTKAGSSSDDACVFAT